MRPTICIELVIESDQRESLAETRRRGAQAVAFGSKDNVEGREEQVQNAEENRGPCAQHECHRFRHKDLCEADVKNQRERSKHAQRDATYGMVEYSSFR